MIRVSAFRWVPPFAQGLVRDLRVRWALEEAGLAYEERLIGPEHQASESYRRLQPFGQVPALMPSEPAARARSKTWMFAALNTVEPPIQKLAEIDLFHAEEEWAKLRRPAVVQAVKGRLASLAGWLNGRDYLEERFTAADVLMTTVLLILRHTDLVAEIPELEAYRLRCEARPAFRKALADHMAPFAANAPPGV